jgi:hypothetical protein
MHKAISRKIGIFLTGFILLAWVAVLSPSLCAAGMHELSDGEMAAVSATGFSSFTLDGTGLATLDFNGVNLSTYTTIDSMKMGYYTKSPYGLSWDNDWTTVSLGSPSTDLVFKGLYIQAQFTDVDNPATRQLEYVRIGTTNLTGDISAYFNRLSSDFGSLTGTVKVNGTPVTYSGGSATFNRDIISSLGSVPPPTTINANNTSFSLTLSSTGGFSFHWGSATIN